MPVKIIDKLLFYVTDPELLFNKKSRLSPNLNDILSDDNFIKYFAQFMQSIGELIIIKCWLELENFTSLLHNQVNTSSAESQIQLNRTKSFDLDWCSAIETKSLPYVKKKSTFILQKSKLNSPSSASCHNIAESIQTPSDSIDLHNSGTITEKAVELFKKYIAVEAPYCLRLTDDVRKRVIGNICQPKGAIAADCFEPVKNILFHEMDRYISDFQKSPYYKKAQIDFLISKTLDLRDILHNDTILFYFMEYLEQESCSNLLECIIAITYFRDNLKNTKNPNSVETQQDALVVYEKYFSLQATNPVGITTNVRLKVESEICRDGGPLYSCFDEPYQIIFVTLNHYAKSFLESEVYYKYLSEMIRSVDEMSSHPKTQSECSSEISSSTQNTLLAMEEPTFQRRKRNLSVPDMTIDSNQLYNADALWQRRRNDGLNLGRVNSLGRFESKFEPDPDKKESVFKKVVNRFVPSSNNKVEEEMAWQIAHMIVKDVTDLTMAPPDNLHEDHSNT